MAWVFNENRLGQSRVGDIDTEAMVPVGTILTASSPDYGSGEFIYLAGVTGTVAGVWVTYDMDAGTTALMAADAIGPVAVATATTVGSTWGWYQIDGKALARLAASTADNVALYIDGTPGVADDSLVAGDRIQGAFSAAASDTLVGNSEVTIHRPFVTNIADA